ncbi:MAG: ShlB/FhaC/HecB family hemolysin secretion/activation protein [Vicinamibacterales bacterium]
MNSATKRVIVSGLVATAVGLVMPARAFAQVPPDSLPSLMEALALPLPAAQPGETVLVARLAGILFRASPDAVTQSARVTGYDAAAVPLLQAADFAVVPAAFLGRPASYESIQRLAMATRAYLQQSGYPLVAVFVPPQVIDGGTVQVVVQASRVDSVARVEGARYFSSDHYLRALRLEPGEPVQAARLADDLAWLNRQPFHQVGAILEPGALPGTTDLVLRVQERRPFTGSVGYDNMGTPSTGRGRLFAGVTWGNLFGRGHSVSYQLRADPAAQHVTTHSASYAGNLPWRHTLTLSGAWTSVESVLPEPFTQAGTSWQAGLRYGVPVARAEGGWEGQVAVTADFKYSDNTLEFSAIPIVDSITHIVQAGATLSLSRGDSTQQMAFSASVFASPGRVTGRNTDAAFDGSRLGAEARYAYGRIDARYSRRLPRDFEWSGSASAQRASGPLLGTEQMSGGGSAGVRGFLESSAFADEGVLLRTELSLPSFTTFVAAGRARLFAFLDAAAMHSRGPGNGTSPLAAAGAGFRFQVAPSISVGGAYGWPLAADADVAGGRSPNGHITTSVTW